MVFILLVLLNHPARMLRANRKCYRSDVKRVPRFFSQTALQTDAPGCHSKTNVTILSMEKRTKSKATLLREPKPSAMDLVAQQVYFLAFFVCFFLHVKMKNWTTVSNLYLTMLLSGVLLLLELLSIQSAEENDFVVKYSPKVWKGNVNVWLGMYYDTNSKYNVTRKIQSMKDNFHGTRPCSLCKPERENNNKHIYSCLEKTICSQVHLNVIFLSTLKTSFLIW